MALVGGTKLLESLGYGPAPSSSPTSYPRWGVGDGMEVCVNPNIPSDNSTNFPECNYNASLVKGIGGQSFYQQPKDPKSRWQQFGVGRRKRKKE